MEKPVNTIKNANKISKDTEFVAGATIPSTNPSNTRKKLPFFLLILVLFLISLGLYSFRVNSQSIVTQTPKPSSYPSMNPNASFNPTPPNGVYQPTVSTTPRSTTRASPSQSDKVPPTITSLGGPQDGSIATFTNICFPMIITDNVSKYPNLFIRTQFDSDTWSEWSTNVSPCYNNVSTGNHRFSVQTKDEAGNISSTITRNFTVQPITISLSGQVYRDANCSTVRDSGENGVAGVTVNIYQKPSFTKLGTVVSDGSGNYAFTKSINEGENYILEPIPVSPSGYKANPKFNRDVTLNSDIRSSTIDIPQVPNENVGLCQ